MRHFFRCHFSGRIGDFGNEPGLNGVFRQRIDTGQVRGRVKLSASQTGFIRQNFPKRTVFSAPLSPALRVGVALPATSTFQLIPSSR